MGKYQEKKKNHATVFQMSGIQLAFYILPFPIVAFILCVLISIIKDFDASTSTHCRVRNYLPSISAAIGGFTPQRYIWRICIGLHCAPRLMLAVMFYNYFCSFHIATQSRLYKWLAWITSFLHILENLFLVTLSYVSSTENYEIHENSFIAFVVCSQLYMLLTCIMFKWSHHGQQMTRREKKSFRYKCALFVFNVTSFLTAVYFFFRHNSYCEPGVYTAFALCEYLVVSSNIAFNGTAFIDFGQGKLHYAVPLDVQDDEDEDVKKD